MTFPFTQDFFEVHCESFSGLLEPFLALFSFFPLFAVFRPLTVEGVNDAILGVVERFSVLLVVVYMGRICNEEAATFSSVFARSGLHDDFFLSNDEVFPV